MKRVQSILHSQLFLRFLREQDLGVPVKFASVVAPERRPDGTLQTDAEGPSYAVFLGEEGHEMNLVFRSPTHRAMDRWPGATYRWPTCFETDCRLMVDDITKAIQLVGRRNLLTEEASIV